MKKLINSLIALQVLMLQGNLCAEEATDAAPQRDQGFMQTISMILIALVFFYFILWRPEQKRRKEMEQQRSAMKKGDRVTAMGIIGNVFRIQEHTVILRMVDGSKIEVIKAAITDVMPASEEDAKKIDKDERGTKVVELDDEK
jgi:preprotein translocase subunit YajC